MSPFRYWLQHFWSYDRMTPYKFCCYYYYYYYYIGVKDDGAGAIRHAKLQSNRYHQNNTEFVLQAGCPSCRPTNSDRALKEKVSHSMALIVATSAGFFQLTLTTKGSWLPWGGLPTLLSAFWRVSIIYRLLWFKLCRCLLDHQTDWLEPVSLMIKNSRLRWFGHVEPKDDNEWVKRCMTWEGIRRRGHLKKTGWNCVKNDMGKFRPVPKGCAV